MMFVFVSGEDEICRAAGVGAEPGVPGDGAVCGAGVSFPERGGRGGRRVRRVRDRGDTVRAATHCAVPRDSHFGGHRARRRRRGRARPAHVRASPTALRVHHYAGVHEVPVRRRGLAPAHRNIGNRSMSGHITGIRPRVVCLCVSASVYRVNIFASDLETLSALAKQFFLHACNAP